MHKVHKKYKPGAELESFYILIKLKHHFNDKAHQKIKWNPNKIYCNLLTCIGATQT